MTKSLHTTNPHTDSQNDYQPLNVTKKSKFVEIYLSPTETFHFSLFMNKLEDIIPILIRFFILLRVCYGDDANYKMLGKQIAFFIPDKFKKASSIKDLHDNMLVRLDTSMMNSGFNNDEVISIQLLF